MQKMIFHHVLTYFVKLTPSNFFTGSRSLISFGQHGQSPLSCSKEWVEDKTKIFASHGVPALSLFTICLDNKKTIDCSVKPFSLARLSSLRKEGKSAVLDYWRSQGFAFRFEFLF